jgi:hypothetical protein
LRMGNGTIGSPKRPPMPLPPRSGGGHRGSAPFRLPHTAQIATLKLGTGVHLRNPGLILEGTRHMSLLGVLRSKLHAMPIKDISDIAAKWTAVIAAIVGGWIALQQYIISEHKTLDDRQKEVLDFYARYSTDPVLGARQSITKLTNIAWDAYTANTLN